MKILKIILWLYILLLISSCGTVKEAFTNQRKNGSEEFLVEKKSPLSMPPNFDELPVPKSEKQEDLEQDDDLQNLILSSENNQKDSSNKDTTSENNLEISILNQINKN